MNTSVSFENSTARNTSVSFNTETVTLGPKQLPSFVIPVSVVVSILFIFIIIGTASFYVWRRNQNRPKRLPLPNPYPENNIHVKFSTEKHYYDDDDDDDNRTLIQPQPSQRELSERNHLVDADKEPIYKNQPNSQEKDSAPIYENFESSHYENCNFK